MLPRESPAMALLMVLSSLTSQTKVKGETPLFERGEVSGETLTQRLSHPIGLLPIPSNAIG